MGEIDLTAAVKAGKSAWHNVGMEARSPLTADEIADVIVRAAAPIIKRAERERLGGICGDPAPHLVLAGEEQESGAGVICELHHGHVSEWHEAPNGFDLPPMRWRPASVTISGDFDA